MYIPEGRRHCPNFLWGLPASAASCRLPPLSDRVGLRSCCWLLVCMRKNQAVNACNAVLSSFVHWPEPSFYFKKGRKQVGKTLWTHSIHNGKGKVRMGKRVKVSESPLHTVKQGGSTLQVASLLCHPFRNPPSPFPSHLVAIYQGKDGGVPGGKVGQCGWPGLGEAYSCQPGGQCLELQGESSQQTELCNGPWRRLKLTNQD